MGCFLFAAAQQGADARREFGKSEGLHEVIVGAGIEADDAVFNGVLRGQHEHRSPEAALAHGGEHFDPAAAGQHNVEHNQIKRLGVDAKEAVFARVRDRYGVGLRRETLLEGPRHFSLVFDYQNAHTEHRRRCRPPKAGPAGTRATAIIALPETAAGTNSYV